MNEFTAPHIADLSAMVAPDRFSTGSSNRELHLRDISIVEKAIQVGGTCTGEHGVGIGKRKFMQMEHGESFELMRQIKNLIDPKGLMNPGKIF